MDTAALKTRLIERLDEASTPVYWTSAELLNALNKGQRLFALLTLCIERTATLNLSANTTFYTLSASPFSLTDYLLPLRVTCSGKRLSPATINDLDGLSSTWRTTSGIPTRYVAMGFDFFAITPRPTATGTSLILTYAAEPAVLVNDADVPEIPAEHHADLVDFALWWAQVKVGGAELANATQYLGRFLEGAGKYAEFTRARSQGQQYDKQPFDLRSFDKSRLLKLTLPRQSLPKEMRAA